MPVGQTNRRALIAGPAGAAAWPLMARAQQAVMPVIGVLAGYAHDFASEVGARFEQRSRLSWLNVSLMPWPAWVVH